MQFVLLGVPFLDEFGSGLPVVGAPALQAELGASFAGLTLAVFTAPQLAALVLDPPALLYASRFRRSDVIAGGLAIYALALVAAAMARSAWLFAAIWTVTSIATGVVCAAAQSELVDRRRGQEERVMAEWTLGSALGDVAGPLLLAGLAALGFAFRSTWLVAALVFAIWAAVTFVAARSRSASPASAPTAPAPARSAALDPDDDSDGPALTWLELLRAARATPGLLGWLLATTLCSLMDETLVALAALFLPERFGEGAAVTWGVIALMVGGLLGLLVLHRAAEGVAPRRLLFAACAGSVASLVLWLAAPSLTLAFAATFALGFSAAMHYPLAQAAAYRCLPNDSRTVAALSQFFGPVDLAIPLLLGLLADRFGLEAALLGLLIQPLALVLASRRAVRAR